MLHYTDSNPKTKSNFKQIKKILLQSNLDADLTVPLHLGSSQPQPQFDTKLDHPSLRLNSKTFSSKTPTCDSSTTKRLKLKDYLHLSSLQKNAKAKSSNKTIKNEEDSFAFSTDNSLQLCKNHEESILTAQTCPQKVDCSKILKEQISKKIQEEIGRLQELSLYLSKDYSQKPCKKESDLFLFQIMKGIDKTKSITSSLGETISKYEGEQRENDSYYWRRKRRVLHSPAKMQNALRTANELNFNVFEAITRDKEGFTH